MSVRPWRSLLAFFDRSRGTLAASAVLSVAQGAVIAPTGYLVARTFNTLIPRRDVSGIFWTSAAILAAYLVSSACGLWTRWLVLDASKKAVTRLRSALFERIYALPRAYFDRADIGRLHSIVVQDSERVDSLSGHVFGILLPAIVTSIGLAAVLAVLNLLLFATLVAVVPILLIIGQRLGSAVRLRARRWQSAFDVFNSRTQLALRAITLTKVRNADAVDLEERRSEHAELGAAGRDMVRLHATYANLQNAVAASSGAVVLAIGGRAVALGEMKIGSLLAFYAVLALLLRQMSVIAPVVPQIHTGYEALVRIEDLLALEDEEPYSGTRRITFRGGIELDRVTFAYGAEPVLVELSLRIESGEHVAIVGPNGAGKSTLANLVLGLYRPSAGRVLADGVPYDELDMKALRRSFGVVLDDPIIFPGSIRENIAYGDPTMQFDEIERAARLATADAFIDRLPGGFEADAGYEGGLLSGGQRQRVAIARALSGKPSLLMLDEPTSHLDDASISQLFSNLARLPGAPTIVVISHDPDVARHVDVVHRIRDGRLVESTRTSGPRLVEAR